VKSFTTGLKGDDLSFGTKLNYPNDLLNFRIGYLQIGKNFIPDLDLFSEVISMIFMEDSG
jgi:hypothetical protein